MYKLILDSKLGASINSSSPSKAANKALRIDFLNTRFTGGAYKIASILTSSPLTKTVTTEKIEAFEPAGS